MNYKNIITEIKKDKKTVIIITVGILGIILLALSNYSKNDNINSIEDNIDDVQTTAITSENIEAKLEKKLVSLLSSIKGVGNVSVMVTVSSTGEYVYAENKKYDKDSDSVSTDTEIVLFEENDNDTGLIISVKNPDILGVAVVCEGGDNAVVKSEITQLITSLFGIGSNRVYVGSK